MKRLWLSISLALALLLFFTEFVAQSPFKFGFVGDAQAIIGMDGETAVSKDYKQGDNKFTGKIVKVTIDVKPSELSAPDKKAVEIGREVGAAIED